MNGAVQPEPGADLDLPAAGRALRARQAAAGPRPTVRDAQARPLPPPLPSWHPTQAPGSRLTARALVAARAPCAWLCARRRRLRARILHGRGRGAGRVDRVVS